ncbi:MAG: substrate-binding domain-containing protein [Lentisphaerae bacterium]|nr:substrate-binding domain-containing protein [Lentisphaerota bacterium]
MPAKHDEILTAIRDEIVGGQHPPGTMLPTRVHYEQRFGATAPTVQKAFDRLLADGFVFVRHRVGTFVSARPPHLNRYAVTLPYRSSETAKRSRFFESMHTAALEVSRASGREIIFYAGLAMPGDDGFQRLCADVAARRLAGIIHLRNLPVIDDARIRDPAVPSVVVAGQAAASRHGVLFLEYDSVIEAGAAYLASHGCRRVALLEDREGLGADDLDPARRDILARHGLELAANGYASLPTSTPSAARYWVRLLVSQRTEHVPDGLIVLDDNLTPEVTRGLTDPGVIVPAGFKVVTHNNFPTPMPADFPLYELGYDAAELLAAGIRFIDGCRAGANPERVMRFKARTLEEIRAGRAPAGA